MIYERLEERNRVVYHLSVVESVLVIALILCTVKHVLFMFTRYTSFFFLNK